MSKLLYSMLFKIYRDVKIHIDIILFLFINSLTGHTQQLWFYDTLKNAIYILNMNHQNPTGFNSKFCSMLLVDYSLFLLLRVEFLTLGASHNIFVFFVRIKIWPIIKILSTKVYMMLAIESRDIANVYKPVWYTHIK